MQARHCNYTDDSFGKQTIYNQVIVRFVDIGGIVDHRSLKFFLHNAVYQWTPQTGLIHTYGLNILLLH